MKATEAKEISSAEFDKAYTAAKAMIDWAASKNRYEVDIDFELMTPALQESLERDGYMVAFHRSSEGVCFNISWKDPVNVEMRDLMFKALKKSIDVKLRFAIDRFYAGQVYEYSSAYIDAVFNGDIKLASKLCGTHDFLLLMKVKSVLV